MKLKELIEDFGNCHKEGYMFDVYVAKFRGRKKIVEVSGSRINPATNLPHGFSFMSCEHPQREMRQCVRALELAVVPYSETPNTL